MFVLGWNGSLKRDFEDNGPGYELHDGAAVLVDEQGIVAAIEEERLNRVKHSNFFPTAAIRFCLGEAGIGLGDVDRIVLNTSQQTMEMVAAGRAMASPGAAMLPAAALLAALFQDTYGVDVQAKIRFCNHHLAHAASAYFASGQERSLVVTLDGDGDGLCGMVLVGENGRLRKLKDFHESKSLGNWYTAMIKVLGYGRFDEYKVMGLAPYGDPKVYGSLFKTFYRLLPNGDYELAPLARQFFLLSTEGLIEKARKKGEPFTQAHKDFAAALQAALEDVVLHLLRHYRQETGQAKLCLAGGVAHNCSMNGQILYSNLFEEVFVQPAAHDAGTSLGAAWLVLQEEGKKPRYSPTHLYLGTDVGDAAEIGAELAAWGEFVAFEKVEDVEERAARLLADGAVLGWAQGRSEFGPRALGNRSILADPRPADNKQLINQMVKKREGYRPFAPSVQEERAGEFFATPPRHSRFPYMIFVLKVRPEHRQVLGAITHVDGTARVHTVSREDNPRYWKLLGEFGRLTGIPMLLNTSFNNNAEPIVDSAADAVTCFLTTGLHYLVLGDYLVGKREVAPAAWRTLAPALRQTRKLVRREEAGARGPELKFALESTASDHFCEARVDVPEDLFQLLLSADGRTSLAGLFDALGTGEARRQALTDQVVDLWGRRVLVLRPAACAPGPHL
jgi:carbamoyltransferase